LTLGSVGATPVVNVLVADHALRLPAQSAVRTRQYQGIVVESASMICSLPGPDTRYWVKFGGKSGLVLTSMT
jgi:hypothetical protein